MRRAPGPANTPTRRQAWRRAVLVAALLPAALLALVPMRACAAAGAPAPTPAAGATPPRNPRRAGTATTTVVPKSRPAPAPASTKTPRQLAADTRSFEEIGAYARAAQTLRQIRARVRPDADLELSLALDEARSGQSDSAAARLWSPMLERALADTLPLSRHTPYPWDKAEGWLDGRFDGWHWYVARARAELAARQGRWQAARDAARQAVAARLQSGKEWLILAICAGRAGDAEESERAARAAAALDPTLPEALYVTGLYDWRAGHRLAAQDAFRAAVALDSSYRAPALALVRSRLPGVPPDSLPGELLTGIRAVGLLTSPDRPKLEEFEQMDVQAAVLHQETIPLPDSLKTAMSSVKLLLALLVGENGRAMLHDLPWSKPGVLPDAVLRLTLESVNRWRFSPALKHGQPRRMWANVQVTYQP